MNRFIVLLILAVAPLAIADSFDFQGAGSLSAGTAHVFGRIAPGRHWGVTDQLVEITDVTTGHMQSGVLGTIDLLTGSLMKCGSAFCFTGGTVDVDGTHGNSLFDAMFTSGSITIANGITILDGRFKNGGATLIKAGNGNFSTQVLTGRTGAVVPESGTMGLLGSGLLGLAMLRRKKTLN